MRFGLKMAVIAVSSFALLFASNEPVTAAPKASYVICPSCGEKTATQTTTRKYQHNETFTCVHGGTGKDVYKVYEVTVTVSCDSCNYSKVTSSYEDHVLVSCPVQ